MTGIRVEVRGGQGFDVLQVSGVPAADATYTPDSTYRVVPGNENYFGQIFQDNRREFFSYSGTVVAGRINELLTTIRYEEFDDGHRNIQYRYSESLPRLAAALQSDSYGA